MWWAGFIASFGRHSWSFLGKAAQVAHFTSSLGKGLNVCKTHKFAGPVWSIISNWVTLEVLLSSRSDFGFIKMRLCDQCW